MSDVIPLYLYIRPISVILGNQQRQSTRTQRLSVRAHLLATLSEFHPQLQCTYGPNGKPLDSSATCMAFNYSHSRQQVALAFSPQCETVGVDIESADRVLAEGEHLLQLARRSCHPNELVYLDRHHWSRQAFLMIWTRKEAILKADGCGITLPLASVDTVGEYPAVPLTQACLLHDPRFGQLGILTQFTDQYYVSVAWRSQAEGRFRDIQLIEL